MRRVQEKAGRPASWSAAAHEAEARARERAAVLLEARRPTAARRHREAATALRLRLLRLTA